MLLFKSLVILRRNMMLFSMVLKLFPLDYTMHHDDKRKQNYISRHSNEDWTRGNIESAAWLSRWILWEKPSLREAITHANKMYQGVKFVLK